MPAGGRRYLAIATLAKRKRAVKTVPVPCVVKAANRCTRSTNFARCAPQ